MQFFANVVKISSVLAVLFVFGGAALLAYM